MAAESFNPFEPPPRRRPERPDLVRERVRTGVGVAMLGLIVYMLWCGEKCVAFALSNGSFTWDNLPDFDKAMLAALVVVALAFWRLGKAR